jgi:tRNA nucleotidyltransferase/poly(A) polymerase
MKNILTKIFSSKNDLSSKEVSFLEIVKTTKVSDLFKAISNYNDLSEIRYVGGCVRKILNNEKFDDIDLATNLKPDEVKECLKNNNIDFFETGIDHGTITARIDEKNFEITSLRKDVSTDGRRAVVEFTNEWTEDALRRDFTINSIYADKEGNLFDPNDGVKDLENGKIEFIGDPEKRVKEDYLRILRYVRFFLNYSKQEHKLNVKKIIKQNIGGIVKLSKERLIDELKKLVISNGFINIGNDEFCKEIVLLIFPQVKNIDIFKKLNKNYKSEILKKDFIFLLSLLIIDETDSTEFFLYKFNVSNEAKKRINFLKEIYDKSNDKNTFSKNNLQKIFYFQGKSYLLDVIDFKLFRSNKKNNKLIELKKNFEKLEKPQFPLKAKIIMEKYKLKESKELGQKLKYLENLWVENSFKISEKEVENTFLS